MKTRKTDRADLENKRFIFLEIGMIVSLSIALLAFSWKTADRNQGLNYSRSEIDVPEEIIPVTQQKPPEMPKVQPPKVITVINIVEDDLTVEDEIFIDAEANDETEIDPYVPALPEQDDEESEIGDEIFTVVESQPSFPGGDENIYKFLAENLKYPEQANQAGIHGKVYLTFVVEKDGSITDVKVLRGIGGGCDEEAVRVVKLMPRWTPGKQRGIPVRVHFVLSVKFTLY